MPYNSENPFSGAMIEMIKSGIDQPGAGKTDLVVQTVRRGVQRYKEAVRQKLRQARAE